MQNKNEYTVTKYACYTSNIAMSVVGNLSPLLFVAFKEIYNISYTLLGLLVVVNFFTQLLIDLIFSFFPQRFNIIKTIKTMPLITVIGLLIYAIMPTFFPQTAYLWIVIGTIIFSVSAGLNEVLASPIIATIPSENTDKEVSKLHSIYAWGVVLVVVVSTLFLFVFGRENWMFLALIWTSIPLTAFLLFLRAEIPPMTIVKTTKNREKIFSRGVIICIICIFLGGASEVTMAQWMSGYLEKALAIPKIFGDVLGVAVFSVFLGLGRTLYAKKGKNVLAVMQAGMIGATICYIVAGVSLNAFLGLFACVLTGFCVSMLWPGTIVYVSENFASAGVAVYALMAAGGDLGASVAPQLVGVISDKLALTNFAFNLSQTLNISPEQIAMRAGLLFSALFPLAGILIVSILKRRNKT